MTETKLEERERLEVCKFKAKPTILKYSMAYPSAEYLTITSIR